MPARSPGPAPAFRVEDPGRWRATRPARGHWPRRWRWPAPSPGGTGRNGESARTRGEYLAAWRSFLAVVSRPWTIAQRREIAPRAGGSRPHWSTPGARLLPTHRGAASGEDARRRASVTEAAFNSGLRLPTARRAQLTPFLTKFRSSTAARSMSGRLSRKRAVAGRLVVKGKACQQRERRALDELLAPVVPLGHLAPRVGCLVE